MSRALSDRERFPELFVEGTIDRRSYKRVVPMKVLVCGLFRTGTKSLRAALRELGYFETYHMDSCMENPPDCDIWAAALDAKFNGKGRKFGKEDWDQLLGHCQAVCDVPTAAFMPELIAAYPDAKVILTIRDLDAWQKSCEATVMGIVDSRLLNFLGYLDTFFMERWLRMLYLMLYGMFQSDETFRKRGKEIHAALHDEIRGIVPKERLLEYRLVDGWEPLCKFLGHDIPKNPFPRINESAEYNEKNVVIAKRALLRFAKRSLPVIAALAAVGGAYFLKRL